VKLAIGAGNGGGVSGIISGTGRALLAGRAITAATPATGADRGAASALPPDDALAFGFAAARGVDVRRARVSWTDALRSGFRAGLREERRAFAMGG
jgi:hypothetical protein